MISMLVPLLAALVSASLAVVAWPRRRAPGGGALILTAVATAVHALGYAFELASVSLEASVFWDNVQLVTRSILPGALLVFVLQYTGRRAGYDRRVWLLLAVAPAVTAVLAWTNPVHGLLRGTTVVGGPVPLLTYPFGPRLWLNYIYIVALVGTSSLFLVQSLLDAPAHWRGQFGLVLAGILIPAGGSLVTLFDLLPPPAGHLEISPITFTLADLVMGWALFRYRLLDVVPVARTRLFESLADGVIVLDGLDRVIDLNPAARRIAGSTGARIIGQPAAEVLAGWPELVARLRVSQDTRLNMSRGSDDALESYDVWISPLHQARGEPGGRLVVLHDVAEQQRAEERLRQLSQAVEQSPASVVITDTAGNIRYVNPRFTALTGYTPEEVIGQNPRILSSGRTPPEEYERLWTAISSGGTWQGEFYNRKKNGELYVESAAISAITDAQGMITHFLAVKEDITERKRVQEELQAATLELRTLYELAAIANANLDLETMLKQALDRVLAAVPAVRGSIYLVDGTGGNVRLVAHYALPGGFESEVRWVLAEADLAGRVVTSGEPVLDAGAEDGAASASTAGAPAVYTYAGFPLKAGGRVLGVLSLARAGGGPFTPAEAGLLRSAAGRVGMAVENARLRRQAEQVAIQTRVAEERERLARDLHDWISQSLFAGTLLAESARQSAEDGQVDRAVHYATRVGQTLQQAMKELRLLIYQLRPAVLAEEGLAGALRQRLTAVEGRAGVQARLVVADGWGDPAPKTEEVLFGIAQEALNNALKHACARYVKVTLGATSSGAELEIADDGEGFDLAVAVHSGGLGLASMRQRAESAGGRLEIVTAPGQGTRVRAVVPGR